MRLGSKADSTKPVSPTARGEKKPAKTEEGGLPLEFPNTASGFPPESPSGAPVVLHTWEPPATTSDSGASSFGAGPMGVGGAARSEVALSPELQAKRRALATKRSAAIKARAARGEIQAVKRAALVHLQRQIEQRIHSPVFIGMVQMHIPKHLEAYVRVKHSLSTASQPGSDEIMFLKEELAKYFDIGEMARLSPGGRAPMLDEIGCNFDAYESAWLRDVTGRLMQIALGKGTAIERLKAAVKPFTETQLELLANNRGVDAATYRRLEKSAEDPEDRWLTLSGMEGPIDWSYRDLVARDEILAAGIGDGDPTVRQLERWRNACRKADRRVDDFDIVEISRLGAQVLCGFTQPPWVELLTPRPPFNSIDWHEFEYSLDALLQEAKYAAVVNGVTT